MTDYRKDNKFILYNRRKKKIFYKEKEDLQFYSFALDSEKNFYPIYLASTKLV